MFEKQSEKIVNVLIENKKVEQGQKEIIQYGIHALLTSIANTMLLVCIGLMLNMLLESIVLLVGFSCLRSYAGGYHCKTELRCLVLSNSIFIMILVISMLTSNDMREIIGLIAMCVGAVILVRFAPVESENKQLDAVERNMYKKRVRILLVIEMVAILILRYVQIFELAYILSQAIFILGIMVWVQKYIDTNH